MQFFYSWHLGRPSCWEPWSRIKKWSCGRLFLGEVGGLMESTRISVVSAFTECYESQDVQYSHMMYHTRRPSSTATESSLRPRYLAKGDMDPLGKRALSPGSPHLCLGRSLAEFRVDLLAPKDHQNIRILHSGSKAPDVGDSRHYWFVGSLCVCGLLAPFKIGCSLGVVHPDHPKPVTSGVAGVRHKVCMHVCMYVCMLYA